MCEGNQGIPNLLTTPKFLSLLIEANIKDILGALIKQFSPGQRSQKNSDARLTIDSYELASDTMKDSIISKAIKILDRVYFKNDALSIEGIYRLSLVNIIRNSQQRH